MAGKSHCQAHAREVEHGEAPGAGLGAEARHDEIRRGTDQRGHAAQDGAEGQRHEQPAWGKLQPPGQLHRNGHQEGHGADIVHESRQRRPPG